MGPTVLTRQAKAPKCNLNEQFVWPLFTALTIVAKHDNKERPVFGRKRRVVYEQVIREDDCTNLEWLKQNKLTPESQPYDWNNALLPLKKKTDNTPCTVFIDE